MLQFTAGAGDSIQSILTALLTSMCTASSGGAGCGAWGA